MGTRNISDTDLIRGQTDDWPIALVQGLYGSVLVFKEAGLQNPGT